MTTPCSPPPAQRWGGVGGGGYLSRLAARGASCTAPHPRPLPATRKSAWEEGRRNYADAVVTPPSTMMVWPVMKLAASLPR